MNQARMKQVILGAIGVCLCLLLTSGLLLWSVDMGTAQTSNSIICQREVYLPLLIQSILSPTINATTEAVTIVTDRVSVSSEGTQANSDSGWPSISTNGRFIAFTSDASNLVNNDNNGFEDVFIHDRQTGQTYLISVSSDGIQGNHVSNGPSISANGRCVAFTSYASNLVSGDTNGTDDVFLHDRLTGQTSRVSIASDGTQANGPTYVLSLSANGRYVAFASLASNLVNGDTNDKADVFVHDRQTGQTIRVSVASDGTQGNDVSYEPSVSADGRYTAFRSEANNLVSNDNNGVSDIFVYDLATGQTSRVSISSSGEEGNQISDRPVISADGRYVTFPSWASNLVDDDTNGIVDIFVHDRQTGQTTRVSVDSYGTQANDLSNWSDMSADGRYITFSSEATNLVDNDNNGTADVFMHDRQTGLTSLVSIASDFTQGNYSSESSSVSDDGRYVAFLSFATNLVNNDTNDATDIFIHELSTMTTPTPTDTPSSTSTSTPTMTATATNTSTPTMTPTTTDTPTATFTPTFTPTPTDTPTPTYTPIPTPPITTTLVSISSEGVQGNGDSFNPVISADGRYVAFDSEANNLVSGDTNGRKDVFVFDRQTEELTRVSVSSEGGQGNSFAIYPTISGDGRYIAFHSESNTLVPNDTNNRIDVFIHDQQTGQTDLVSVASDGTQGNDASGVQSISADGRYVVFASYASNLVSGDTNSHVDIFVRDRQMGQTIRVSVVSDGTQSNGYSNFPDISADGRYVAFYSEASNLVSGDTNSVSDIFVHDRQTGQTSRVSVASDGTEGYGHSYSASISDDGRFVTFSSLAYNLVPGDTNGESDVFVHDLQTGQTTRVSVAFDGSQGDDASGSSTISVDGRYVTIASSATNLISGDGNGVADIFVHDRQTGQISRVSIASDGMQANGPSLVPFIAGTGRFITFASDASNLVSGDTNGFRDIFVHDRGP